MAAAGWLLAGDGLARLIASCAAIGAIWLAYVLAVPDLRAVFVTSFWSRFAGRGRKPGPPDDGRPASARTGVGRHRAS
jgi:putative peptidoglycan lipid II flippase